MISKEQFVQQYKRAAARHSVRLPKASELEEAYKDYLYSARFLGESARVRFSFQPSSRKLVWEARAS